MRFWELCEPEATDSVYLTNQLATCKHHSFWQGSIAVRPGPSLYAWVNTMPQTLHHQTGFKRRLFGIRPHIINLLCIHCREHDMTGSSLRRYTFFGRLFPGVWFFTFDRDLRRRDDPCRWNAPPNYIQLVSVVSDDSILNINLIQCWQTMVAAWVHARKPVRVFIRECWELCSEFNQSSSTQPFTHPQGMRRPSRFNRNM